MVNPRHSPQPDSPTIEECRDYFERYLANAAHEKGGLGYTWKLLQKNFPLDEFDQEKTSPS